MLWRFSPLPAGFWDGVSGTHIWPSAGFSKPTITNDELEILFPGINPVRARSGKRTNQTQSINLKYETRSNVGDIQSWWHRNYFDSRCRVASFWRQKAA